jgi:FPC/CPF motif-containing protein YcgG
MLDPRQEIVSLISLGFQSRNLIESQVADYHAERLMEMWEQSRICAYCGSAVTDDLANTIWAQS